MAFRSNRKGTLPMYFGRNPQRQRQGRLQLIQTRLLEGNPFRFLVRPSADSFGHAFTHELLIACIQCLQVGRKIPHKDVVGAGVSRVRAAFRVDPDMRQAAFLRITDDLHRERVRKADVLRQYLHMDVVRLSFVSVMHPPLRQREELRRCLVNLLRARVQNGDPQIRRSLRVLRRQTRATALMQAAPRELPESLEESNSLRRRQHR
mmetsp:Transcript_6393/g.24816  ORF Transcript_6393/g.24816 Transcript_6393/m.24816 type:complete len:206 (-) Transcript_6393:354-971(-)